MAKKPSVRYFASRQAYYFQHKGRQHKLAQGPDDGPTGPTYLKALAKFKEILELDGVESAGARNTVRAILEKYVQHIEARMKPGTVELRAQNYRPFVQVHGETAVGNLTHFQVEEFIDEMRKPRTYRGHKVRWGNGSVRTFIDSLQAALNWAVKKQLIPKNPLKGLEKPDFTSRSRDCLVSPEQHLRIVNAASKSFRPFVEVLEATGARPSELAAATAQAFDAKIGALVYYPETTRKEGEHSHKSARKKKVRKIYLTGRALQIVKTLCMKHPEGPLFRTRRKLIWTIPEITSRLRVIRAKVGMPKLTAYSYRHTFATRWLESGKSVELLAELLGNTPAVIQKHYSHITGNDDLLRKQLADFRSGT
jgi:integrase